MSKLDWEKQNRRELPKEYLEDMERHSRKRAAQKKYRLKKKAKAIKRKDTPKDRRQSFEAGKEQERERIIKLLKLEFGIGVDLEKTEMRDAIILSLIELIRKENK